MAEQPILFSGAMARAILDGRKTQTRRVVKPILEYDGGGYWQDGRGDLHEIESLCPYGKPGDLLWVREVHYRFGHWEEVLGVRTKGGRQKWKFVADTPAVLFDAPSQFRKGRHHKDPSTPAWHKRLARFMPRWASRILLDVVEVRVELLQAISEADAMAEGVDAVSMADIPRQATMSRRADFAQIWDLINGKRAPWASNPWVWVVGFKRVEGEE